MGSIIVKKRLRNQPTTQQREKSKKRSTTSASKVNWLEQARQARARTKPSSDSTEILRAFRSGETRLSSRLE